MCGAPVNIIFLEEERFASCAPLPPPPALTPTPSSTYHHQKMATSLMCGWGFEGKVVNFGDVVRHPYCFPGREGRGGGESEIIEGFGDQRSMQKGENSLILVLVVVMTTFKQPHLHLVMTRKSFETPGFIKILSTT